MKVWAKAQEMLVKSSQRAKVRAIEAWHIVFRNRSGILPQRMNVLLPLHQPFNPLILKILVTKDELPGFDLVTTKINIMKKQSQNQKGKSVKAVPEGMHTVTPFLVVEGANEFIRFIEQSFDGKTTSIMKTKDGKVMHANVQIGDSQVMVTDATEKYPAGSSRLYLYVDDVDTMYKKALDAKGTSLREPTDEFYGDRSAGVKDAWGNEWWVATHIEDVDDEEMERRAKKFRESAPV